MTDWIDTEQWPDEPPRCDTLWGSHACELEAGHTERHYCGDEAGPCSALNHDGTVVFWDDAAREWIETGKAPEGGVYSFASL